MVTPSYQKSSCYSPVKEQICGRILNKGLIVLRKVLFMATPGLVEVLNGNLYPPAHIRLIPRDEIC